MMKKAIFCSVITFSLLAGSQAYSQGTGDVQLGGGDWTVGTEAWSLLGSGVVNCTSIGDPFSVGATKLTVTLQQDGLDPDEYSVDQGGLILGWAQFLARYPDLPVPTSCSVEDADVKGDCSAMVLDCGGEYYWVEKGNGESGGWLYTVEWDKDKEEWVLPEGADDCHDEPIKRGMITMKCAVGGTLRQ